MLSQVSCLYFHGIDSVNSVSAKKYKYWLGELLGNVEHSINIMCTALKSKRQVVYTENTLRRVMKYLWNNDS